MKILEYKRIFLTISLILVILSSGLILGLGFNLGIDFKGGTVYEIRYKENSPLINEVKNAVSDSGLASFTVQKLGGMNFLIKTPELSDQIKSELDKNLSINNKYVFEQVQLKTISPSISTEFKNKSIAAIILVVLVIILFISYVFRGVSRPVSSYKYGLIAIIALIHDVIIPTGLFALLGYLFVSYQIDVLFVTAILAILGYSVNDTIVVFDRVRENLKRYKEEKNKVATGKEFEEVVEKSLKETITRSIFTSLTTLLVITSLYFLGGESTKPFALVLGLGVLVGTYSSIFLASPLLVYVERFWKSPEKKEKEEMTEEERIEELTKLS